MTAAHAEEFTTVAPGVEICFQTFGDRADEPLLLVMGLGGPMTWWDDALCQQLAEQGFFVIRFDNRDVGRSSRIDAPVSRPALVRAFLGLRARAPYSLDDMAADAFGLLDHLDIGAAHVCGVSMGGMIAQTMTLTHPERVLSLTSIMSTTGARLVGWQHPSLVPVLLNKRGPSRDDYIRGALQVWGMTASVAYPPNRDNQAVRAGQTFDRGVSREGVVRQMMAILTQPDRTSQLRRITVPTTVVHGLNDKLVHVSGGRATAAAIPGSELLLIDGMGHDLPPALFPTFARAVRRTADRARG